MASLVETIFGSSPLSSSTKKRGSKKTSSAASKTASLFDRPSATLLPPQRPTVKREPEQDDYSEGEKPSRDEDTSGEEYQKERLRDAGDVSGGEIKQVGEGKPAAIASSNETIRVESSAGIDQKTKKKRKHKKGKEEEDVGAERQARTSEQNDADAVEDAHDRTVFVGNLPIDTTRKSLARLFRSCGNIESTRIRSVAVSGVKIPADRAGDMNLVKKVCVNTSRIDASAKSSVSGYVVFADALSVPRALALNNTQVKDPSSNEKSESGGRILRVDRARAEYDSTRSVFVGNLPYGADEDSLRRHFCEVCDLAVDEVHGVRIVRDRETFRCRGFGYVLLADRTAVSTALRRIHGTVYEKRELRVAACGRTFKGRQGEPAPPPGKRQRLQYQRSPSSAAALKRILTRQAAAVSAGGAFADRAGETFGKKRRPRGERKKRAPPGSSKARTAGKSKRAAAQAKADKRAKKIQKRISKGMGKARK